MKNKVRILSFLLAGLLLLPGCEAADALKRIEQGDKFGGDWINSEIEGTISESTITSVKDDYFTAVNKDWILSQTIDESGAAIELLNAQKEVDNRKIALIKGTAPECENSEALGLDKEELLHAESLIRSFVDAAGNIEKRNADGCEPLRPFIEAITNISSLDELTNTPRQAVGVV